MTIFNLNLNFNSNSTPPDRAFPSGNVPVHMSYIHPMTRAFNTQVAPVAGVNQANIPVSQIPIGKKRIERTAAKVKKIKPKRGRKRIDKSNYKCLQCSKTNTPEWRKGPCGPNTLCNACGLQYAKVLKQERERKAKGSNILNRMNITFLDNPSDEARSERVHKENLQRIQNKDIQNRMSFNNILNS